MDPISMDSLFAKLQAAREATRSLPVSLSGPSALAGGAGTAGAAGSAKSVDFSALLKGSLDKVDKAQSTATKLAEQFQLGDPKVTLEDSMVALQKANVSFQAALQIRNRVVAAYHEIMNLQI
jgi:flagellar hook-basal body complex protein FliE